MRSFLGLAILVGVLIGWAGFAVGQAVPKSIFDDDGNHPFLPPDQAQPSPQPAPAPTPAPTPAPDNSNPAPTPHPIPPPPPPPAVVHAAPIAVPTPQAQQASLKLIDELYKGDIANATTPELKIELAKKMMGIAEETTDDPVGKYVLLATARDVAISSGDPPTAFKCLDELAQGYQVDYVAMKLDLFKRLAEFVKTPQDQETFVEGLNRWMDQQVAVDHYDSAATAGNLALQVARRSDDKGLSQTTTAHVQRIGAIAAAYAEVKSAAQALGHSPNDAAANLAMGRFLCFIKGDWKRGLPMLSMSNDAGLCALAEKELAGVTDANAQVAIGDGWWDQGETATGLGQEQIRRHAVEWYQAALPRLSGLAQAKANKRIGQLAAFYPQAVEKPPAGKTVTNTLGMKLVEIEPGTFLMGSPPSEPGYHPGETQHRVTLTKGFFMAATDVTVGEFREFVRANKYTSEGEKHSHIWNNGHSQMAPASWGKPGFDQENDDPVVEVSWSDAQAFCRWLSKKEGKHYRLPTEAEWEYAARAGTTTAYYFGDDAKSVGVYEWTAENSDHHTHPVGQKKPNGWGLYDMTGDVKVWCSDYFDSYADGDATDPTGAQNGDHHVQRGSSWVSDSEICRCAQRFNHLIIYATNDVGFRVVMQEDGVDRP